MSGDLSLKYDKFAFASSPSTSGTLISSLGIELHQVIPPSITQKMSTACEAWKINKFYLNKNSGKKPKQTMVGNVQDLGINQVILLGIFVVLIKIVSAATIFPRPVNTTRLYSFSIFLQSFS